MCGNIGGVAAAAERRAAWRMKKRRRDGGGAGVVVSARKDGGKWPVRLLIRGRESGSKAAANICWRRETALAAAARRGSSGNQQRRRRRREEGGERREGLKKRRHKMSSAHACAARYLFNTPDGWRAYGRRRGRTQHRLPPLRHNHRACKSSPSLLPHPLLLLFGAIFLPLSLRRRI
jgi:hypothetical protein